MYPKVFNSSHHYAKHPKSGQINKDYEEAGPADHGFTATFKLGDLVCGEAHTFMIYYISNTFMTGIPRFLYFRIREKVESTNEHRPEHSVSVSSDVSVANPTANQTLAGIE